MSIQFSLAVIGWIAIGIFAFFFQRSLKRMRGKPPEVVIHILNELPDGWRLVSYKWDDMEWEADLAINDRLFRLFTDVGRIFADEVVEGKLRDLPPRQIVRETLIPKTLVEQLIEASNNYPTT